jgi:hypothetical protein
MIPPRPSDLSPEFVDLTEHYNATLNESWYTPNDYPVYYGKLLNTLPLGKHVLNGTPFDIRGLIQLNNREKYGMKINFPLRVLDIKVAVTGNQIHFLHGAVDNENAGTPVAVYRIKMANGTVHQFGVRWDKEINSFVVDGDSKSPAYTAWRAKSVTQSSDLSDAILYQSTWNNPTPEVEISTVDYLSFDNAAQPFLVAMSVESFTDDLNSDPEDAERLSLLALRKLTMGTEVNDGIREQVQSLIAKAIKDAPDNSEVWRAAAEIRMRLGTPDSALEAIERSLSLRPIASDSWRLKGKILGKAKRFTEARVAQEKVRAIKLQELIPARDATINSRFIDLSNFYNVGLQEFPYQKLRPSRVLSETFDTITPGLNLFGDVEFDVRGVVALEGSRTSLGAGITELSPRVEGIRVDQSAKSIHLLHGAGWGNLDPYGTCIGKLILNYDGGESAEIEIKTGEHVLDWFLPNNSKRQVSDGKLVWVRPSKEISGRDIGLYTLTWQNPQPDRKILSFDYESTMNYGASFLLGVTLEK